ncbi:MAG: class I SAM-dependent methyltransferase [Alphaproteobacteria bacterium]
MRRTDKATKKSRKRAELFSNIYRDQKWGIGLSSNARRFYSGEGSHSQTMVPPYVEAMEKLFEHHRAPLDAVDLGCGDFNIGSRIRHLFGRYIACDIVAPLVEFNRHRFTKLEVDFRCLDIVYDDLPRGDVAFVRQVLQHLPNEDVQRVARKLGVYKYVVVTEERQSVGSNDDRSQFGVGRLAIGVDLSAHPFNLAAERVEVLLEIAREGHPDSVLVTTLYEMRSASD